MHVMWRRLTGSAGLSKLTGLNTIRLLQRQIPGALPDVGSGPPRPRNSAFRVGHYSRLVLIMLMAYLSALELSAQCQASSGGLQGKGTFNPSTGIRTIRIGVPPTSGGSPTVYPGTRQAMLDAIGAWNAKKGTTKVEFEPVGYSDPSDILFELNNAEVVSSGGLCARGQVGGKVFFESALNNIGENPTEEINGRTKGALITQILTHELGHVLNLAHANGTIMEQASGGSNCLDVVTNHMPSVSTISNEIAESAKLCANKSDPVSEGGDGGFYESEEAGSGCWAVFFIERTWDMNDYGEWYIQDFGDRVWQYEQCGENPYPV